MPGFIRSIFGLLLTFVVLSAYAENTMHVAAMNYPAWLVRNHQVLSLPGFESIVLPGMLHPGLGKPRVLAMPGYGSSRIPRAT